MYREEKEKHLNSSHTHTPPTQTRGRVHILGAEVGHTWSVFGTAPHPDLELLCPFFQTQLRTCLRGLIWIVCSTGYLRSSKTFRLLENTGSPPEAPLACTSIPGTLFACNSMRVWKAIFEERLRCLCCNAGLTAVETHLHSVPLLPETWGETWDQPSFS